MVDKVQGVDAADWLAVGEQGLQDGGNAFRRKATEDDGYRWL